MKVSPNNVVPGSKITYKGEPHIVYKVNDKTIYIGKQSYDMFKQTSAVKKSVDAILYIGGFKTTYSEDLQIKDSEIVAVSAKQIVKQKRFLDLPAEKEIKRLYEIYKKNNGKSYRHTFEIGNKEMKILACNDKKQVLISHNYNLFFYDIELDLYTFYRELFSSTRHTAQIMWPNK